MQMICEQEICTGCGMCVNVCPNSAISMKEGKNGFVFPVIDESLCCDCGLCAKKCPAKEEKHEDSTYKYIYAGWNKNRKTRDRSTSGGIFYLLASSIIKSGGAVAGVRWSDGFSAEHCMAENEEGISAFFGSKYVQSDTGYIYKQTEEYLKNGKWVLFSGTPCQVRALQSYLGKEYEKLVTVDLVCHGVPSQQSLNRFLSEINNQNKEITNIGFRCKAPYWDYSYVRVDFKDGEPYKKPNIEDPFFTSFNIGYLLRESCHTCRYAVMYRYGDITLSDFWGYTPKNFKMKGFLRGVSMIMINSDKGKKLFDSIKDSVIYEQATEQEAKDANMSLTTTAAYTPPKEKTDGFWLDYNQGLTMDELRKKYIPKPFTMPNLLWLRRLKRKYQWLIKK